jgi:hypothetical protein
MHTHYDDNVFVNCPFDKNYEPILYSIIFAVHDCGYSARTALDSDDGSEVRITKIQELIRLCRYGIHDISRIEVSPNSGLPRFNMPLELGIFLGAKSFGSGPQELKKCMILDTHPYRYQRFCSDIAGQDIHYHEDEPKTALKRVRNWLSNHSGRVAVRVPGGTVMARRYEVFQNDLPLMCNKLNLDRDELQLPEYRALVCVWLQENKV